MSGEGCSHSGRNYASLIGSVRSGPQVISPSMREQRMREVADALWDHLGSRGVSWLGFYLKVAGKDEMILGPRRDKPACSPIGMHGMCGRGWIERQPIVIRDVRTLGGNYIACDPRDLSELVIPLFESDGSCWGVFDADSYETGSFDSADVEGITNVLTHAGLSAPQQRHASILFL